MMNHLKLSYNTLFRPTVLDLYRSRTYTTTVSTDERTRKYGRTYAFITTNYLDLWLSFTGTGVSNNLKLS